MDYAELPPSNRLGFNAQHAPMGAFMSFTFGCPDAPGGMGVEIGRPTDQDLFIGVWDADGARPRCLPFVHRRSTRGGAEDQDASYLYTRCFAGLGDVLHDALDHADALRDRAAALDDELTRAPLTDDQRFMIAHATCSYYGSTQLLERAGRPCWVVNQREYYMMNTLDLAVDQVFFELDRNPCVVRNLLDHFAERYAYRDGAVGTDGRPPQAA